MHSIIGGRGTVQGLRAVVLMVQMSPEGQNCQGTFGPCLETFWLSQLGT